MTTQEIPRPVEPGVIIDDMTFRVMQIASALDLTEALVEAPFLVTTIDLDLATLPENVARAFAITVLRGPIWSDENKTPSPFKLGGRDDEVRHAVDILLPPEQQLERLGQLPMTILFEFEPELRRLDYYGGRVIKIQDERPEGDLGVYFLLSYESSDEGSPLIPACCAAAWKAGGSDVEVFRPTGDSNSPDVWVEYPHIK